MLEIVFLGTSGSMPTKSRGLPAIAMIKNGEVFLFDCGEGTQRQAMTYGINISRISAIFLTHTHGDHVLGIAGLARTLALNKRTTPLYIFVPKGDEQSIAILMKFDKALISYPIVIKGIRTGMVYKGNGLEVSAFPLRHSVPAYGYRIEEPERIRFKGKESKAMGLKGTMFSELEKKGSITIDGKKIKLSQVTYKVPGKRIVYASDTRPTKATEKAAHEADLLIHESSYGKEHQDFAKQRMHSTSEEVAALAKRAKVKKLVLVHISARYKTSRSVQEDARKIFPNTKVAEDGDTITL